ncbi:MAG: ATP-binding protein [Nitrospinae bacterium]|nr:ATP-binding protein [Nitrospinota bacterium]
MKTPIKRIVFEQLKSKLQGGKVLVLYGPRRTGKTFLLEQLKSYLEKKEKILFLNGESRIVQENISSQNPERLKQYLGNTSLLIVDEAQEIQNIGLNLKIIVDTLPHLKVIASGSASFDLAQKVGEPLTGRKKTLNLYPVSCQEIINNHSGHYYQSILESLLIFGCYPELFSLKSQDEQREYLLELVDSFLFKDILKLEKVKNPKKLKDLLTLLAFQIGQEVSLAELGNNLDLHKDTVARYLDLLEKSFVLINIRGFSRNLRKEVIKNSRYYFYDNGIRNALINNYNPLKLRDDAGRLWENYIVVERLKKQAYTPLFSNNYFWRTYDQQELDWVEEREGRLFGYEIKWGKKKAKCPRAWLENYSNAGYELINQENFLGFIA